jgi:hypothetical protein
MKILITEEQFKTLSGYLMEQSSPDEIYQKYYSKIDRDVFDKIIEADPKTIKGVKVGKYAKILLGMFKNENLLIEDLPKASYYLSLVYKYNRSIPNNINSLVDIYKIIEDKIIRNDSTIKDVLGQLTEGVDYIKVFETKNWWIFIPKTEKGAAYLGLNTEWCTTYGEHCRNPAYQNRDENAFDEYNNQGPLYIIINKHDEGDKYQIHIEKKQFKDKNDDNFLLNDFFENNMDLVVFFENLGDGIIQKYIENGSVGDLNLTDMPIKTLGNLETVGGNLLLYGSKFLTSLGNLKKVKGHLKLYESTSLNSLGNLEWVGGILNLHGCSSLTSLNNLKRVEKTLNLEDCTSLISLDNLEYVGEWLDLGNCSSLISLGNLKEVGGYLDLSNCTSLISLGNIKEIRGNMVLNNCTSLKDLGNLEMVVGWATLKNCISLTSLGNLKTIWENLNLDGCTSLKNLGKLKEVRDYIYIKNTPFEVIYESGELEKLYPQFGGKFKL